MSPCLTTPLSPGSESATASGSRHRSRCPNSPTRTPARKIRLLFYGYKHTSLTVLVDVSSEVHSSRLRKTIVVTLVVTLRRRSPYMVGRQSGAQGTSEGVRKVDRRSKIGRA